MPPVPATADGAKDPEGVDQPVVNEPVVVDAMPARVRRPADGVRLFGLVLALGVIAGIGTIASTTSLGAQVDLARLISEIPQPVLTVLTAVGGFGALGVPLAYIVRQVARGRVRLLVEALGSGLVAIAVALVLGALIGLAKDSSLYQALVFRDVSSSSRPLDDYLVALVAFATVSRATAEQLWRTLFAVAVAIYMVSAFTSAQATAISLLASVTLGATVGVAVRYLTGSVNTEPPGSAIAAALRGRDVDVVRLERRNRGDDHRAYLATIRGGAQMDVRVFDRDRIASGVFYRVYRTIRLNAEIARGPVLSLERGAERRALLAMAMAAARVPVARLLAGVPCGPDTIVLGYEEVDGQALAELDEPPTDDQLDAMWAAVGRLHRNRVTHRGLTARQLRIDADGQIVFPIPADGAAFASDLRIRVDRADLLVATAQLVGAAAAVRIARTVVPDAELTATMPVLQPVALNPEARAVVKRDRALIERIREQVGGQTSQQIPELSNLDRVRPRTVITVVAAIVAGYLLIGQLGAVNIATVLSGLRWQWLPLVVVASAVTYLGAALALTGYVQERLIFARTVLTQLAASFTGFVTPPSVGGIAVNLRYLQRAGLSTTSATTSVGTCQAVNAVVHIVLLIGLAAVSGSRSGDSLPIPGWAFIALGATVVVVLSLLGVPIVRRWAAEHVLPPVREIGPRLLELFTTPVKLAQGLLGTLLLNAAYIAALWCATQAFGGSVPVLGVAVVYLAGGAIGSLAPTPGGLGAVEAALSTGLTAAGMSGAAAISAVLVFRLATFWLPVPVGWAALSWLQQRHAV